MAIGGYWDSDPNLECWKGSHLQMTLILGVTGVLGLRCVFRASCTLLR